MKFFIFILVLVSFLINNVIAIECYWSSECKYKYYSSKTPYENIRGDIRDSVVKPKGCEPISVWAIMRHGKKNPGLKFLQHIKVVVHFKDHVISSYDNGNSSLCAEDVDNFRKWKLDNSFIDKPNTITKEGYQEMVGIGSRLKEALPELLNDLHEGDYLFRPTFGPRTEISTEAFIEGLENRNLFIEKTKNNYSIANPYTTCQKYLNEVFHNPDTYNLSLEYMETAEYLNMKERVERRLSLNFTLTNDNIIAIYDLCRYISEGISNKYSPWCAIFSEEDLKILEYVGDLQHYSKTGYETSHYSNIFGQIPLAELFTNLEQAKSGKGKKIVVYFTHSAMMDMIQVALNLYQDASPLTGAHRDLNRKWRSTFTSTFGVNLIAVLNRCKISDENLYDHNIAFYMNERPILELCNEGVCTWQEFEDTFKPFLNATTDFCEFDETS